MFRILHIDDEELIRTYLEDIVLSLYEDVEIVSFSSWGEAEKLITEDQKFNLVLLDEVMPFMNGSEIMAVLLENYSDLADKVVFVAGPSSVLEYDRPHIKKPFDLSAIKELLDDQISKHKA